MFPAKYWVEKLKMKSHPEGGYFAETYRSTEIITQNSLPKRFSGNRNYSTGIYFLLESHHFSAFHRIQSDEMWHFYAGQTLTIYEIENNGNLITHQLGPDLEKGETFQCVIKAGNWFGSRCEIVDGFSLVGCTVSPGFDFADFELANKNELCQAFPELANLINEMTY